MSHSQWLKSCSKHFRGTAPSIYRLRSRRRASVSTTSGTGETAPQGDDGGIIQTNSEVNDDNEGKLGSTLEEGEGSNIIPFKSNVPIDSLPEEILAMVFEYWEETQNEGHAKHDREGGMSVYSPSMPVGLDRVCKKWRAVVRDLPIFRRCLKFTIHPDRLTLRTVDVLHQLCERTWNNCAYPVLSICQDSRSQPMGTSDSPLENPAQIAFLPLERMLAPISTTLHTLLLVNVKTSDLADLECGLFPKLNVLEIMYKNDVASPPILWNPPVAIRAFVDAPLQTLMVVRHIVNLACDDRLLLPWTEITSFYEIWSPGDPTHKTASRFMRKLLPKCHNLRSLSIYLCPADTRRKGRVTTDMHTLPSLQSLSIGLNMGGSADRLTVNFDFWNTCSFPLLKSFNCVDMCGEGNTVTVCIPPEVMSRLETWTIRHFTSSDENSREVQSLRQMLAGLTGVQELQLLCGTWQHWIRDAGCEPTFSEESLTWLLKGKPGDIVHPQLRHLIVHFENHPDEDCTKNIPHLITVLERFLQLLDLQETSRRKLKWISLVQWPWNDEMGQQVVRRLGELCTVYGVELLLRATGAHYPRLLTT